MSRMSEEGRVQRRHILSAAYYPAGQSVWKAISVAHSTDLHYTGCDFPFPELNGPEEIIVIGHHLDISVSSALLSTNFSRHWWLNVKIGANIYDLMVYSIPNLLVSPFIVEQLYNRNMAARYCPAVSSPSACNVSNARTTTGNAFLLKVSRASARLDQRVSHRVRSLLHWFISSCVGGWVVNTHCLSFVTEWLAHIDYHWWSSG